MRRYVRALSRAVSRRRGAIALIVALSAPVLVGFGAMAVDLTYWYGTQESLQTAADAGALAAARTDSSDPLVLQTVAANAANAATGGIYRFSAGSTALSISQQGQTQGMAVSVIASAATPLFLGGILGLQKPQLQASATAQLHNTYVPPASATCFSSSSYTYVAPNGQGGFGFTHEAGVDPTTCGNTSLIQPLAPLQPGYSGQVQDMPIELTSGGGAIPNSSIANDVPSYVPSCSASYNPNAPTTSANTPSSVTNYGVTTYFGPATMVQSGGGWGGFTTYSFSPITVGPGSSFCDAQNLCIIPAGAYCGGLQINPGITLDFVTINGSDQFMLLDGNMLLSTADSFGTANDSTAKFYFGGSSIGSLILDTQTTIDASGVQNGTLVFTSTAVNRAVNGYGTTIVDQLCPLGVLPIGVDNNGNPICPTEQTTSTNGVSTTYLNTTNTVTGPTTQGYTVQTNQRYASYDTYTTTVSFMNGQATHWQAAESTATGLIGNNGSFAKTNQQNLNYAGNFGVNASSSASSTAPASCTSAASNGLFGTNTATNSPNLGLSYASSSGSAGSIALTDSVAVCGSGQQLIANPSGAELIAGSGGGSKTVFLSQ